MTGRCGAEPAIRYCSTDSTGPSRRSTQSCVVASDRELRIPVGTDPMKDAFAPVLKQSLSDRLARRIRGLIQAGEYTEGDRLPPIMEMARRFGVGHPSVREALKKLETMGVVEIRHGSGVYVSRSEEVLVLASPDFAGTVTKKLLVDLIRARTPLETQSAADAAKNATVEHLREMRRLLTTAG